MGIRTGGLHRLCFLKPLEQAASREGKAAFVTPRCAPSPRRHHAPSSLLSPARSTSGWKHSRIEGTPTCHTSPWCGGNTADLPSLRGWFLLRSSLALKSSAPAVATVPGSFPVLEKSLWFFRVQDCSHHFAIRARPELCSRGERDELCVSLSSCGLFPAGQGPRGAEGPPSAGALHPRPLEALLLPTKLITALGELINLSTPACKKKRVSDM